MYDRGEYEMHQHTTNYLSVEVQKLKSTVQNLQDSIIQMQLVISKMEKQNK